MTYPHQSCAAGSIRYVQNRIVEIVVHTDLPGQVKAIAGFSRKYVVRDIGAVGQQCCEYCTEEIHGNIVPNMRNLFKRQRKSIHTPVRVCVLYKEGLYCRIDAAALFPDGTGVGELTFLVSSRGDFFQSAGGFNFGAKL